MRSRHFPQDTVSLVGSRAAERRHLTGGGRRGGAAEASAEPKAKCTWPARGGAERARLRKTSRGAPQVTYRLRPLPFFLLPSRNLGPPIGPVPLRLRNRRKPRSRRSGGPGNSLPARSEPVRLTDGGRVWVGMWPARENGGGRRTGGGGGGGGWESHRLFGRIIFGERSRRRRGCRLCSSARRRRSEPEAYAVQQRRCSWARRGAPHRRQRRRRRPEGVALRLEAEAAAQSAERGAGPAAGARRVPGAAPFPHQDRRGRHVLLRPPARGAGAALHPRQPRVLPQPRRLPQRRLPRLAAAGRREPSGGSWRRPKNPGVPAAATPHFSRSWVSGAGGRAAAGDTWERRDPFGLPKEGVAGRGVGAGCGRRLSSPARAGNAALGEPCGERARVCKHSGEPRVSCLPARALGFVREAGQGSLSGAGQRAALLPKHCFGSKLPLPSARILCYFTIQEGFVSGANNPILIFAPLWEMGCRRNVRVQRAHGAESHFNTCPAAVAWEALKFELAGVVKKDRMSQPFSLCADQPANSSGESFLCSRRIQSWGGEREWGCG